MTHIIALLLVSSCLAHAFVPIALVATSYRSAKVAHHLQSKADAIDPSIPRICIVGGGFGGVNTALTLAGLPWPDGCKPRISLIDKNERFVFLPLLYELCVDDASLEEVAPTYSSLLEGTDIDFIKSEVNGIDVENNVVHTSEFDAQSGRQIRDTMGYDALVVATGADLNLSSVPGADQFALPFYTVEQCFELQKRFNVLDSISELQEEALRVVVVGGGYSGVELSLNALERLGGKDKAEVTLVHRGDEVLQYATDFNRQVGQEGLNRAGIRVMTNTNVVKVSAFEENYADGNSKKCSVKVNSSKTRNQEDTVLDADLLLWTAGATSTNTRRGALNSILPRDKNGRIVTGKFMRAKNVDNVFALGDCARARQVPYAATAQVAIQQAPVVAWNLFATLMNSSGRRDSSGKGFQLLPFEYLNLGEMMTLGSDDATISSLGGLVQLSGSVASVARRLIYAVRMPTARQGVTAVVESTQRRLQQTSRNTSNGKLGPRKVIDWK